MNAFAQNAFGGSGGISQAAGDLRYLKLTGGTLSGGLVIAQGTLTDPATPLSLTATWNDAADTFRGVEVSITNTASAAASTLLRVRGGAAGATDRFLVKADGQFAFTSAEGTGILGTMAGAFGTITIKHNGNPDFIVDKRVVSETGLSIQKASGTLTAYLEVETNHTLSQRNGANAQNFRVYNTYTDGSNYERGVFGWTSNVLCIGAEEAGTGSVRNVALITNGQTLIELSDNAGARQLGFFGATPVTQPAGNADTNVAAGGSGSAVLVDTTFDGGGGSAYTVGGVVAELKRLGIFS
jgi:hypothetical protein